MQCTIENRGLFMENNIKEESRLKLYNIRSDVMKISITGHRPNKMYGYDIYNKQWTELKEKFKKLLVENNCDETITGMALGVDTVFALAVLELKREGYISSRCNCSDGCVK